MSPCIATDCSVRTTAMRLGSPELQAWCAGVLEVRNLSAEERQTERTRANMSLMANRAGLVAERGSARVTPSRPTPSLGANSTPPLCVKVAFSEGSSTDFNAGLASPSDSESPPQVNRGRAPGPAATEWHLAPESLRGTRAS